MKTRVISILGLAMLGVAAFGCSAETGTPQGGEGSSVGETKSPLILTQINNSGTAKAVKQAASCVIRDGGIDKLLVAGGINDSGTALSDVYLYNPADDTWTVKTSLPAARYNAQMIAIPFDPNDGDTTEDDRCLIIGGNSGSAILDTAYYYDLSANAWTQTGNNLSQTREFFQATKCGTGKGIGATTPAKIMVLGGVASGSYRAQIDVYNANTNQFTRLKNALNANVDLATGRAKFALGINSYTNLDKFLVAGGENGGVLNTMEALTVSSACASATRNTTSANMKVSRTETVAFQEGTADTFLISAGYDGTNAIATSEKVLVTNWSTGAVTVSDNGSGGPGGPSLATARRNPKVVKYSATKWAVVGGQNTALTALDPVQPYDTGTKTLRGETQLSSIRFDFVTEYLDSEDRAILAGGASTSGTAVSSSELF